MNEGLHHNHASDVFDGGMRASPQAHPGDEIDTLAAGGPRSHAAEGGGATDSFRAIAEVRAYLRARRARERMLPPELFGEPAWDILLDLYAAHLEGSDVPISSACIASAVPSTTALRCLKKLMACGLIDRTPDETDARRAYVELTAEARCAIHRWVETALLRERPGAV